MKFSERQKAELRDAVARSRIEAELESARLRNQTSPARINLPRPQPVAPAPEPPEASTRDINDLRQQCRKLRAELGKQRALTDLWRDRARGLGWGRRTRRRAA